MIKFSILLRRHPEMSQEEFISYHKTIHGPLFSSLPEVKRLVRRYVQSHALAIAIPGLPAPEYHGITELWFDNVADIGQLFSSDGYMEFIRPDEEKFIDMHGCGFLIAVEHEVIPLSSPNEAA